MAGLAEGRRARASPGGQVHGAARPGRCTAARSGGTIQDEARCGARKPDRDWDSPVGDRSPGTTPGAVPRLPGVAPGHASSGYGAAWQRACSGSTRPQVRILLSRRGQVCGFESRPLRSLLCGSSTGRAGHRGDPGSSPGPALTGWVAQRQERPSDFRHTALGRAWRPGPSQGEPRGSIPYRQGCSDRRGHSTRQRKPRRGSFVQAPDRDVRAARDRPPAPGAV